MTASQGALIERVATAIYRRMYDSADELSALDVEESADFHALARAALVATGGATGDIFRQVLEEIANDYGSPDALHRENQYQAAVIVERAREALRDQADA